MAKTLKVTTIHDILPTEIFIMILKKLNYKSICLARVICKQWKKVIDNFKIVDACMAKTYVIIASGNRPGAVEPKSVEVIGEYFLGSIRGVASSTSQGGQKAQFAPNFQRIHFLLHFYVTIFWIFQSQGGQLTPLTPQLRRPCWLPIFQMNGTL